MPLSFTKQTHGEESIWGEVASLIADDDLRHHDPFSSHDQFEVKGKRYQAEFATDLARILNNLQSGHDFSSMLVEEIAPFEDKHHVSKSRRTAADSQAFLYETYDIHGDIESVEFEIDHPDTSIFPESDSDIASPLSLSSPASPPSPPVEMEFELENITSSAWESDLFGQILPTALTKAELVLDSISSLSEIPSSSLDISPALLTSVDSSSSSSVSSSTVLPMLLLSESADLSQETSSPKSKRKQPPPRAPQRPRTVRRKTGSDEASSSSHSETESSDNSASATVTPQKRKQSPSKRRVSSQHNKIFETEEVLKLSTKASNEEEQEDVDID